LQLVAPKRTTRTIVPFPDTHPDFSVSVRRLSEAETTRIYDRHGYIPNHEKRGGMGRFVKVLRDIILATVERVDGATGADGAALEPKADETKLLLSETEVETGEGERKTLWQIIQEMMIEAERGDEKNSQTA